MLTVLPTVGLEIGPHPARPWLTRLPSFVASICGFGEGPNAQWMQAMDISRKDLTGHLLIVVLPKASCVPKLCKPIEPHLQSM